MKKLILFLTLALVFSLALPTDSSASSFREVKKVSNQTILRADASPSAKQVTTLAKGTIVTQFKTVAGGWSYVQANQFKGYVATSSLATPKSTIKIASSKSGLVVKETASRNSKTVANLKYNMIVEDFGSVDGGWSFVQYGNVTGYVTSTFISNPKTSTKYVTGAGNYIVRNIASTSGASKGTVKGGTAVTVYSQVTGWSYISSGSLRGYVPSNQLAAKKPVVQPAKLTTFTHLRPSKITWMQFYSNIVDEKNGVFSAYLEEDYDVYKYGYAPVSHLYYDEYYEEDYQFYPPYTLFSSSEFSMGMPFTDWNFATLSLPMQQNKPAPILEYLSYEENAPLTHTGNSFLRTVTGTLTTPAGTFSNVVYIEEKSFNSSVSWHYYFSPGYGLIKIVSSTGELIFELRDYY